MAYYVQGWHRCSFLLTPAELGQVLAPYHFVIDNAHVPLAYTESASADYLAAYGALYALLTGGERLSNDKHWHLFKHMGLTSDLTRCPYGKVHLYQGEAYKSPDFTEPVVHLMPFALSVFRDGTQKLCTSVTHSSQQAPEAICGLQLQYPRKIRFITAHDETPFESTEQFPGFQDYSAIRRSILACTKPLRICVEGEEKNTGIRVSGSAREGLRGAHFFAEKGIAVL